MLQGHISNEEKEQSLSAWADLERLSELLDELVLNLNNLCEPN